MEVQKRKPVDKLIFFLILLLILYFICIGGLKAIQFVAYKITAKSFPTNSKKLEAVVSQSLKGAKGHYSIAIKNYSTGEQYFLNEHDVYNTASVYKLWVMVVVYQQIQNGKLKEDDVLTEKAAVLNDIFDIPDEDAEQTEGIITFTVKKALEQMITLSDNSSALLLTEKITKPSIKTFLDIYSFKESVGGEVGKVPVSSAGDMSLFLDKLYSGEFANKKYTQEMLNLLIHQQLNEVIPKYLLTSIPVAHKTGEMDTFSHDIGIVYAPFGNYSFVAMSNTGSLIDAKDRMAHLSRNVYDYFEKEHQERLRQNKIHIIIYELITSLVLLFFFAIFKMKHRYTIMNR